MHTVLIAKYKSQDMNWHVILQFLFIRKQLNKPLSSLDVRTEIIAMHKTYM
jgi:hypothetical protein